MKFAQTLKSTDRRAPDVFRGSFLNYAGLKKIMKFRAKQLGLISSAKAAAEATQKSDVEFLRMLANQLREIDRRFEKEAKSVITAFDRMKPKRTTFRLHRHPSESEVDPIAAQELAERARWCLEYAHTNATALKKVAKKHDKVFGNKTGQQFVQACWKGDIAVKNFLSAPILSELAAVEALLRSKAAQAQDGGAGITSGESSDVDMAEQEEFKCAVCLDVLYQPVALECGHTFCARCAIATAVGHDGTVGSIDTLLASGPVGCSQSPCPSCRATEHGNRSGVFFDAKRMPHMDMLIRSKFPADWQRRKEEDDEEQKQLKADKAPAGLFHFFHKHSLRPAPQSSH